jgi:hypothetical protein
MQLMEVAVQLPPFKPPKLAPVEYEAPQLLPLPDLLDEEVCISTWSDSLLQQLLSTIFALYHPLVVPQSH